MKEFDIKFIGRTKGSIGVFYPCEAKVIAEDLDTAIMKLYDTYDHVLPICREIGISTEERWLKSVTVRDIK